MSGHKQTGFTIVEMIVVVVIIGILAAISLVSYTTVQQRGRDAQRTTDITGVQKALEKYHAANGTYPQPSLPAGGFGTDNTGYPLSYLSSALVPTYLNAIPTAPSANDYQYVRGSVASDSYGIRMYYEERTDCHRGVNNNGVAWWSLSSC